MKMVVGSVVATCRIPASGIIHHDFKLEYVYGKTRPTEAKRQMLTLHSNVNSLVDVKKLTASRLRTMSCCSPPLTQVEPLPDLALSPFCVNENVGS